MNGEDLTANWSINNNYVCHLHVDDNYTYRCVNGTVSTPSCYSMWIHWAYLGGGGRVEDSMLDCDWWRDRWSYCSICPIISKQLVVPPQTLWYKKTWSVSFLHNSSRISIISDHIWLWTPDFSWRWTLSNPPGTFLMNRRNPKTLVCYSTSSFTTLFCFYSLLNIPTVNLLFILFSVSHCVSATTL